ncbi:ATP-binding protein of ABC transporter, partial [Reticulomyxa filosa]
NNNQEEIIEKKGKDLENENFISYSKQTEKFNWNNYQIRHHRMLIKNEKQIQRLSSSSSSSLLLRLENICIAYPNNNSDHSQKLNTNSKLSLLLLKGLYLNVYENEHTLIVGQSGAGKSTLMKVIAGLWRYGYGDIYMDIDNHTITNQIMFLTQKPYLPLVFGETISGDHHYYNRDDNGTSSSFFDENNKNKKNYQNSIGIIHSLKQQVLFPKFCNSNSNDSNNNENNLQDEFLDTTTHHRRYTNKYDKSAILINVQNILYGDDHSFNNITQSQQDNSNQLEEEWMTDKQLYEIIEKVNLLHLLPPFINISNQSNRNFQISENQPQKLCDWSKVLSVGEQQRLAIARILWHKPKLAFLDECTSALDELNENIIYEQLSKSNITFVSIGHRQSLLKYHHR